MPRTGKNFHTSSSGKRKLPLLLLMCALLLTACGSKDSVELPPEPEDGVLIYAALNPVDSKLERSIEDFNEEHTDVQIQFRDYSDENGPQRLLVELAAGRVPDIMEMQRIGLQDINDVKNVEAMYFGSPLDADLSGFYWMPYRQMVQKGYLEDLWPYIENDPDLGREGVLEAPLKAAEVDGGLYMLFKEVSVSTLVGPKALLGDRCGWTLEELEEAFAAMPPDSTVLRYDVTQSKVFTALLSPTLEQYIDWEAGQSHFDSENFRSMVEFLKFFPTSHRRRWRLRTRGTLWRGGRCWRRTALVHCGALHSITPFSRAALSISAIPQRTAARAARSSSTGTSWPCPRPAGIRKRPGSLCARCSSPNHGAVCEDQWSHWARFGCASTDRILSRQ